MKRIAVFTDIHANIEALDTILNDIKREEISEVYHLGDAIAIGPNPKETIEKLIEYKVKLIRGNHEEYYLNTVNDPPPYMYEGEVKHQRWTHTELGDEYKTLIKAMPHKLSLNIEELKLYLCHYSFEEDKGEFIGYKGFEREMTEGKADEFFDDKEHDIYLYGHYHRFSDLQSEMTGRRYINPGSAGAYHGDYTRYTIIEINGMDFNVIHKNLKYNKNKVVGSIRNKNMPEGEFIIKNFYGIRK